MQRDIAFEQICFIIELLTLPISALSPEDSRLQTFSLTDTPVFEVDRLLPSQSGRRICLAGRKGVMCVELPRR